MLNNNKNKCEALNKIRTLYQNQVLGDGYIQLLLMLSYKCADPRSTQL